MEMPNNLDAATLISDKLTAALQPRHIQVHNNSHQHAGHAGSPNSGRSHFHVEINADCLTGLSRVAAHQRIYAVLADDMADYIHALEITISR